MAPRPLPTAVQTVDPVRPGIGRLTLIALGCFAIGLGWPLFAGIDFVQRPPGSTPSKPEESEPPALESEPDSKPSPTPPVRPGQPARRDEGVRAAAHLAPVGKPQRPAEASPRDSEDRLVAMSGQATIVWKAALLRESPSSEAETLDRLAYGARVSVTGRKGAWYRVKYGRKGRAGWVHRKALGL
jgi:Bacterial SH3 domain